MRPVKNMLYVRYESTDAHNQLRNRNSCSNRNRSQKEIIFTNLALKNTFTTIAWMVHNAEPSGGYPKATAQLDNVSQKAIIVIIRMKRRLAMVRNSITVNNIVALNNADTAATDENI